MTDLVERLRDSDNEHEYAAPPPCNELRKTLAWEAADEIERNRAAIEELVEVLREARNVIRFYKPETFGCGTGNRIDAAITKHTTTTEK